MEDGQQPRVQVEVLDPGVAPDGYKLHGGGGYCYFLAAWTGLGIQEPHVWAPATIDGSGSTWFCSRCRRIERRTVIVVEEPVAGGVCLRCRHPFGDHVNGCWCGCRETVIFERI